MKILTDRCRATASLLLAALLIGSLLLAGCNKPGKPSTTEWKTTTAEGRFSFQMPGSPAVKTQKQDTPAGEVEMKSFDLTVDSGKASYNFMTMDLPAVLGEPKGVEIEQRLEGAQQGAVANVKGKLLESKKVKIVGYPGRDCLVQIPGAGIARLRFALMRRTLFMMEVYNINSKDADRFFASLKLLKDSASAEPAKSRTKP